MYTVARQLFSVIYLPIKCILFFVISITLNGLHKTVKNSYLKFAFRILSLSYKYPISKEML